MTDAGSRRAAPRAARDATKKKRLRADRAHAEAAPGASEEKYRAILETTTDAVILMDADRVIQYANRAIEQMFGYESDEVIGKNLSVLQPERLRQPCRDGIRRYLDTGTKALNWRGADVVGMHRDGHEFPIEVAFSDIMMGGQRMLVGYLRDITERKHAQEKISRLSRIHAVLSGINSVIVRVRDRHELFNEACRIAVEHGGFGMAWIGTLDSQTLDISPVAWSGLNAKEYLGSMKSSARADHPMGQGVSGRAIRERKPIFSNDLPMEQGAAGGRRNEAIRLGYHSRIALPLAFNSKIVGTMVLFARERQFFTDADLELLSELADDISFALEHIDKEKKIARLSRIHAVTSGINSLIVRVRDRQDLFNGACRIAVESGNFGMAWIGMVDPLTLDVTALAWAGFEAKEYLGEIKSSGRIDHPQGQGIVGRAIRERKPIFSNDILTETGGGVRMKEAIKRGYRSRVALPLRVDDDMVGVIVLFAKEQNFFTEEEMQLLSNLAGDISFALSNMAKEAQLKYLAYYDVLTGLPNRTLFLDRITQHTRADSTERMMALVLLDLERFRMVNETLGRQGSDKLLRLLAQRLQHFNDKDQLARISADVFGVMVRGVRDAAGVAHAIENQILVCFKEPYAVDETELRLAAKAGIALFPSDGADADTLFRNAEAALKNAKISGERYLFYATEMNARAAQVLSLEMRLRKAVTAQQFVLHYQPKVEFSTGRIVGLEALIRWNDPETGLVPPVQFIPLLEETGLILDAGRWAIRKALADHAEWGRILGLQAPRIAVNVSPIQLRQKDFVEVVRNAIGESETTPHGLDLEITESLLMHDIGGSIEKLRSLREMDVNVAIDDFGTGYSSLGYLAKLPVNALKIDRSFIITMTDEPDSMTIVSTIISLAHSLNMKVIAEGVETEEQSKYLKLLKCDEMQGYLFSKPLPSAQLIDFLRERMSGRSPSGSRPASLP